jgi:hypothetical protein
VRQANTGEVSDLHREARDLKQEVAEQALELRLLKKSMLGDGGDLELDTRPRSNSRSSSRSRPTSSPIRPRPSIKCGRRILGT